MGARPSLTGEDRAVAATALTILLTGPRMLPYVNREAMGDQALAVEQNKHTKKAEQALTHPLLLRRRTQD